MGYILVARCSCGERYEADLGLGRWCFQDHPELIRDAALGSMGKKVERILVKAGYFYSGGKPLPYRFSLESCFYVCPKCGDWKVEETMDLYYLPGEDKDGQHDPAEKDKLVCEGIHRCSRCRRKMVKRSNDEETPDAPPMKCKKCGKEIKEWVSFGRWD